MSIVAAPSQSDATTLLYQSVDDLVLNSDGIIVGTVVAVEARRAPDQEIYTFVTLDSLEVVKGSYRDGAITLRLTGGHIDGEAQIVVGAPEFSVADRVMVFVQGNGRNLVPVVGWTQGVFRFEAADEGNDQVVDHDGNRILGIRTKSLLKDQRRSPAARIVGPGDVFHSAEPQSSGGSDGALGPIARDPVAQAAEPALSPASFTQLIAQKVTAAGGSSKSRELRSVDDFGMQQATEQAASASPRAARPAQSSGNMPAGDSTIPQRIPQPSREESRK